MATGNTLHVEIVTAERSLYSGEANQVIAPGAEGQNYTEYVGLVIVFSAVLAILVAIATPTSSTPAAVSTVSAAATSTTTASAVATTAATASTSTSTTAATTCAAIEG